MKAERNCQSMPYQVYPNNGGFMPQMAMPMPATMMYPQGTYTVTDKYSNLENQINNLEKRISKLESIVGKNTTGYNDSNFYMV